MENNLSLARKNRYSPPYIKKDIVSSESSISSASKVVTVNTSIRVEDWVVEDAPEDIFNIPDYERNY